MGLFDRLKKQRSGPAGGTGVSADVIRYGESLRNNEMITDISSKMVAAYRQYIATRQEQARENRISIPIVFTLSRAGVIFFENTDGGYIDVGYRDYGYAAVEDQSKREGIAWILQDIVTKRLKWEAPGVRSVTSEIAARESDPWIRVKLLIESEINRYKEL